MNYTTPVLISLLPHLISRSGHDFSYNTILGKIADSIDWKHIALIPQDCEIGDVPDNWYKCLQIRRHYGRFPLISKAMKSCMYGVSLYRALKKILTSVSGNTIVFMESFSLSHVIALAFILFVLPRERLFVWFLYRYEPRNLTPAGKPYKVLNKIFRYLLGTQKFRLLTDSELLSVSLTKFFRQDVHVMPVPHTDAICNETAFPMHSDGVVCWWPGQPRPLKGWDIVHLIVKQTSEKANDLRLVAARNSNLVSVPGGVKVELVNDYLTRDEYLKWLSKCDLILLPYDRDVYRESTSGIFVECIIAGKIPLVTKGTWMALELGKYGLEGLTTDWTERDIIPWLLMIATSDSIKEKIIKMQKMYMDFHNERMYAEKMKSFLLRK